MNLRHKLIVIATLYGLSLTADVSFCAWCIQKSYYPLITVFAESPAAPFPANAGSSQAAAELTAFSPGVKTGALPGPAVMSSLTANAAVGLTLLLVILRLSNRWFLRPVACVREAAKQLGEGNWSFRVRLSSNDEFGSLGRRINNMASMIAQMQDESAAYERSEVGKEAARCVVHNIRGPLTSIRWLAEANLMDPEIDVRTAEFERGIVAVVDKVLVQLQTHRSALTSASAATTRVGVASLLDAVFTAATMANTEDAAIFASDVSPRDIEVAVNLHHFRAMLETLVIHAAAAAGGTRPVTVVAKPTGGDSEHWELSITPMGDVDFAQSNRTSQDRSRHGLLESADMHLVRRVMDMHKGRFEFVRDREHGDKLVLTVPGLVTR